MPDFPVNNGDIAAVTIWATYQASKILNVFHYEAIVPGGEPDGPGEVQNLAQEFVANVVDPAAGTRWLDWTVPGYIFNYAVAQIVYPIRRYYLDTDISEPGIEVGDGCPSNAGATALLRSNKVGRGRSGSKHFTGMANLTLANGQVQAGLKTQIEETLDKALANIPGVAAGLTWEPRIWNAAKPGDINRIISRYVYPEVRIMRRRTLHLGI